MGLHRTGRRSRTVTAPQRYATRWLAPPRPASGRRSSTDARPAVDLLDAILDRLIPADESPGALELGLAERLRPRVPGLEQLLSECSDFTSLDQTAQQAFLS